MLSKVFFFILFSIVSNQIMAASFNCSKAGTETEHLICDDMALSDADKRLGKFYKKLLRVLPKAETKLLKKDQRDWLKKRDLELIDCSELNCEVLFYQIRIKQLGPVEKAGFNCRKARTKIEKKICASRLLKHADGRMGKLYKLVKNKQFIKQNQRDWIVTRNLELTQPNCDTNCAWQVYQKRMEFLILHNTSELEE